MVTEHIGKEANRWEEQFYLGYASRRRLSTDCPQRDENMPWRLRGMSPIPLYGQRQLAAAAGISLSELSAVLLGKRSPNPSTLTKLCMAASRLRRVEREEAEQTKSVLDEVRRRRELKGLRHLARQAGIDPTNLNRVLKGRGGPSWMMLAKLQALLAEVP